MYKELYFVNAMELSDRLQRDEVSDDLAFKHLLASSILFSSYIAIPVVVSCSSSESNSWWFQALNFITCALVQFWGMNLLYRTNKFGDGKAFFLRMATLSLPVGVQVWVIALIMGALYGAVIGLSIGGRASEASAYTWLLTSLVFSAIMQVIHFKLMQKNLIIAAAGVEKP